MNGQPNVEKSLPHVYTIILNWNQADYTLDCLDSLLNSDYPNHTTVVVDNASTDGSEQKICERFPSIHLIRNSENLGYSEGNNVGIRYALQQQADYVFLLNNDTVVDPGMLSKLVEAAESKVDTGITGPTMYYMDPPEVLWGGENQIDWKKANPVRLKMGDQHPREVIRNGLPVETDYIDSCAVLIKREVLEKIGLMDNRYFINFDDLDLNTRARKAGYKVVYVPGAVMWHKVSAAMGLASPATTYYMTRNSLLFFWTHAPGIWKYTSFLLLFSRHLRTIGAWSLRRKYRDEIFRRRRNASLFALRDFFQGRYGRMGKDVAEVCAKR